MQYAKTPIVHPLPIPLISNHDDHQRADIEKHDGRMKYQNRIGKQLVWHRLEWPLYGNGLT